YRQALGLPLLEGRDLEARDMPPAGADAAPPRVALVNEAFVMRFLQGRPAIGRRFEAAAPDPVEIVGIVGQGRFDDLRDSDVPAAYLPIDWARAFGRIQLAVRTSRDRAGVMEAVV